MRGLQERLVPQYNEADIPTEYYHRPSDELSVEEIRDKTDGHPTYAERLVFAAADRLC